MLNFEEEGKLNAIPGLAIQPVSGFVPAGLGKEPPAATEGKFRRVSVEDKQIINSKADVKDRKSTRLNSSHIQKSRMPSSA